METTDSYSCEPGLMNFMFKSKIKGLLRILAGECLFIYLHEGPEATAITRLPDKTDYWCLPALYKISEQTYVMEGDHTSIRLIPIDDKFTALADSLTPPIVCIILQCGHSRLL